MSAPGDGAFYGELCFTRFNSRWRKLCYVCIRDAIIKKRKQDGGHTVHAYVCPSELNKKNVNWSSINK